MFRFRYGGKKGETQSLEVADDMVVVRTRDVASLPEAVESKEGRGVLAQLSPVASYPEAGVHVLRTQARRDPSALRDRARSVLKGEGHVRFAGRVLRDPESGTPVVYTENLFVKFKDGVSEADCKELLKSNDLEIKSRPSYAKNAFFVGAPEGTGLDVFRISEELLEDERVDLCHPELIRQARGRQAFPQQWHLKQTTVGGQVVDQHVHAEEAWETSRGEGVVIAVIDDGVDVDHEELAGDGKVVHPRDVTQGTDNPRPKDTNYAENHGTACAGVACAEGAHGASGVAPGARLMPIRLVSNLGSQAEAEAFAWAADNGADVISCSWGPADGQWWNAFDSRHKEKVPLPDSTRLAIEHAVTTGRDGKGCVITWAAGNGNESADNDGYASFEKVLAVAACNDRGGRSVYSDFGECIWCAFPSSDFGYEAFDHPDPLTPGIWTTDRSGAKGYNPGELDPTGDAPPGDEHGNYTDSFGGTSSACPGVAGVAALVLGANPELTWTEVRDVLRRACDRIDTAGGEYDDEGHSHLYGYGRINAARAVELAREMAGEGSSGGDGEGDPGGEGEVPGDGGAGYGGKGEASYG